MSGADDLPRNIIPTPHETDPTPQTSPARIAANRANALLSTGPRTPDGKARASQNALTHGLRARLDPVPLVPQNEQAEYALFIEDFRNHLSPGSPLDDLLVERIALLGWKLRRHAQAEARLFELASQRHRESVQTTNRAVQAKHDQETAWHQLYNTRKELPPPDIKPIPDPDSAATLLARFAQSADDATAFDTLQRYETATERAFYKALTHYRALHVPEIAPPSPLHHHFHYHRHDTPPPLPNYDKFPNEPNAQEKHDTRDEPRYNPVQLEPQ